MTDGQKDIAACLPPADVAGHPRAQIRLGAFFSERWPTVWQKGGVLEDLQIYPEHATCGIPLPRHTEGQKIEWEMVPMGESFVEAAITTAHIRPSSSI